MYAIQDANGMQLTLCMMGEWKVGLGKNHVGWRGHERFHGGSKN